MNTFVVFSIPFKKNKVEGYGLSTPLGTIKGFKYHMLAFFLLFIFSSSSKQYIVPFLTKNYGIIASFLILKK